MDKQGVFVWKWTKNSRPGWGDWREDRRYADFWAGTAVSLFFSAAV